MPDYVQIQRRIDRGRGQAALRVGQPYDVYRLGVNAAVNYLDAANKIASAVPCLRRVIKNDPGLETALRQGTLIYEAVADFTDYLVGDIWVQNDPVFGSGATLVDYATDQIDAFCLASHGPVKKTFGARIDRLAQLYRPAAATDASGNFLPTVDAALPVVMANGVFSLGPQTATASMIPIGFMTYYRPYGQDYFGPRTEGMTKPTLWFAYMPPTPGFLVNEGDRIVAQDGSRYVVFHPYEQEAGFVGSQLVVERQIGAS